MKRRKQLVAKWSLQVQSKHREVALIGSIQQADVEKAGRYNVRLNIAESMNVKSKKIIRSPNLFASYMAWILSDVKQWTIWLKQ